MALLGRVLHKRATERSHIPVFVAEARHDPAATPDLSIALRTHC